MTLGQAIVFAGSMAFWAALPGPRPGSRRLAHAWRRPQSRARGDRRIGRCRHDLPCGCRSRADRPRHGIGPLFRLVKYAAAAYLIWRGWRLLAGRESVVGAVPGTPGTSWRDMGFGVLITL